MCKETVEPKNKTAYYTETANFDFCKKCWNALYPNKIKKESPKRTEDHKVYTSERISFLKENPICFINILSICTTKATTIQHKNSCW